MPHALKMNKTHYISTLPQAEQKALSVCGIVKDEQLKNIRLNTLAAELEHAGEIFKNEIIPISRERLAEIFSLIHAAPTQDNREEQEEEFKTATVSAAPAPRQHPRHKVDSPRQPETRDVIYTFDQEPVEHTRRSGNAIHNTHPYRTYSSALLFIWMYATLVAFVIVAFRFIMGIDSELNPAIIAAIPISGIIPYFLLVRRTCCPVCNHRLFSMHSFNHNKNAHKLPLLSCSLTTALHIFFFFWFRCPACGTPQKLFGKKRRKH